MDYPKARILYDTIKRTSLIEPRDELFRYAVDYANERAGWRLAAPEERLERDEHRSRVHTCLIDSCNILSRAQYRAGEDNAWRAELGSDRREIGDLACWIALFLALEAR